MTCQMRHKTDFMRPIVSSDLKQSHIPPYRNRKIPISPIYSRSEEIWDIRPHPFFYWRRRAREVNRYSCSLPSLGARKRHVRLHPCVKFGMVGLKKEIGKPLNIESVDVPERCRFPNTG